LLQIGLLKLYPHEPLPPPGLLIILRLIRFIIHVCNLMDVVVLELEARGINVRIASPGLDPILVKLVFLYLTGQLLFNDIPRQQLILSDYLLDLLDEGILGLPLRLGVEMLDEPIVGDIQDGFLGGCFGSQQHQPDELQHRVHHYSLQVQPCNCVLSLLKDLDKGGGTSALYFAYIFWISLNLGSSFRARLCMNPISSGLREKIFSVMV
jgi:hypothetical protein